MDGFTGIDGGINRRDVSGVCCKVTASDSVIDARDRLINDAPGTQAHMAYFRITHLPFGQANIEA